MKTNLNVAREIVFGYFESMASKDMMNGDGYRELMEIKFDETGERLKQHIIAMKNIFEKALEELEEIK